MALNYESVENWTLDEVAVWLHVVNLDQHIKAFERAAVTGKILLGIDDTFITSKLKINAPAVQLVLRQAIDQLNEQARVGVMRKRASDVGVTLSPGISSSGSTFNRHEKRNQTMPPRMSIPNLPPPPAPLSKSAKELMEYKCKYSGQIKKQGGQHKSWKDRFLILSEGCLYYFVNNKAAKAKGAFSIANYRVEDTESALKSKFPNSFKMVTHDAKDRIYYFAFDSPHVLQTWKQRIEDEIAEIRRVYDTALHQKAITMQSPTRRTAHIPEDEDDHIYSEPPPDDDDSDDEQNGYARPKSFLGDDPDADPEDPYTQINDDMRDIRGSHNGPPHNLPSFPPRPLHTLPEEERITANDSAAANTSTLAASNEPGYLTVREANESRTVGLIQRKQSDATTNGLVGHPIPPARSDVIQPYSDSSSESEAEDPYIQFQTKEDVYPDRAYFPVLSREEANSKLSEERYDGMYLIRGSTNVDSDKVLSVWTKNGKCRHYKVFYDHTSQHFSLTSGDSFADIPTLLTHYCSNNLPKSEFTLTVPYGYTQQ